MLAAWVSATANGVEASPPRLAPLEEALSELGLAPCLYPALALLYGAHATGDGAVTRGEIARVLARRPESLSAAELEDGGAFTCTAEYIVLTASIRVALDAVV